MILRPHGKNKQHEHGQILVVLVAIVPVLLLFAGLGIDFGFIYVKQAALSRALDAAALAGMRNLNEGTSTAQSIAQAEFTLNYQSALGADPVPPTFNFNVTTDANSNQVVNVNATATVKTFFLGILPGHSTVQVSSSAQTTRAKLVMSLVLDISYSMTKNGGSGALAPAVTAFVNEFDPYNSDMTDLASMVTFGTSSVVNVAMTQPFQNAINNAVTNLNWGVINYTNSKAGLAAGQAQINGIVIPAGQNVVKVAVFFTDGWPNVIQDSLQCGASKTATNLLYCGCDTGDISLGLCNSIPVMFSNPSSCSSTDDSCNWTTCTPEYSAGVLNTYPSQQTGNKQQLTDTTSCSSDAMYRTIQTAKTMQSQGIFVYSIGLGTAITNQAVAQDFLRQVANDPASSTFNPNAPIGAAVFAPDTSTLTSVFQTIASMILLRITQ
jgi:Flp pilus assembly protein TadG